MPLHGEHSCGRFGLPEHLAAHKAYPKDYVGEQGPCPESPGELPPRNEDYASGGNNVEPGSFAHDIRELRLGSLSREHNIGRLQPCPVRVPGKEGSNARKVAPSTVPMTRREVTHRPKPRVTEATLVMTGYLGGGRDLVALIKCRPRFLLSVAQCLFRKCTSLISDCRDTSELEGPFEKNCNSNRTADIRHEHSDAALAAIMDHDAVLTQGPIRASTLATASSSPSPSWRSLPRRMAL